MPLRWEVDDVPRAGQEPGFENEHPARSNLFTLARRLVDLEVLRKSLSKLKSNAPAHNTDAVHSVYEGLRISRQDVATGNFYHLALI